MIIFINIDKIIFINTTVIDRSICYTPPPSLSLSSLPEEPPLTHLDQAPCYQLHSGRGVVTQQHLQLTPLRR
jgi:hypothetical protein